jgi:hypothetical protein
MVNILDVQAKGLKRLRKESKRLPAEMLQSKESAMRSVGFMVMKDGRDFIESEGKGQWPKVHPFTAKFFTKFHRGARVFKRRRKHKGAYEFMGKFVRYRVFRNFMIASYGKQKDKFDRNLQRIGAYMEGEHKQTARTKVRRLIARSRSLARIFTGRYSGKKGKDFFLWSKNKEIKTPKRSVDKPLFKIVKPKMFPLFGRRYVKALGRRNKLADRDFRGGISAEKE